VILVRFLLFLALAAIVVAAVMYLFKKDRRYLRFIGQVVKYTIYLLAGVMVFYAFDRLLLAV
jgi:small-conductance mechanosensitive channel